VAFAWAILTSYSRPYLGKHYPGDIICGAVVGVLLGIATYLFVNYIYTKITVSNTSKEQHKL